MSESREPTGVLLIDKQGGLTSHDVVGRVRRLFGTRRVGHTGTLDPMATGVLVLLLGRAAKAAEYLTVHDKCYEATLRLGCTTDTEDITGNVLTKSDDIPDSGAVFAAAANFEGLYLQTPPMVSALKVNGQKLLELARRGEEVARTPRPVTIHRLTVAKTDSPTDYHLTVHCSAGTYIRTLCADIGRALGCGGVMAALRRTAVAGDTLTDCVTLAALEAMTEAERLALLRPVEALFAELLAVKLPAFYLRLCRSGCEIYQKKLGTDLALGECVRLLDADGAFFALGEVRDYPDGTAIKAIKTFVL